MKLFLLSSPATRHGSEPLKQVVRQPEKAEQVRRIAARLQTGKIDMEQARAQINEILRTFSQIEWWGHADELLAGDADFARELREWYRDFSRLEPVDASPIAAAEAQEFFWALQVYGM